MDYFAEPYGGGASPERPEGAMSPPGQPIPMVLHCPRCRTQHVDAPEPERGWTNPPHKSHLCHGCGLVWRPADVPTTGVAATQTRGSADTWPPERPEAPALEHWIRGVVSAWQEHWMGKDHRYGRDFAAFVGERLLTDFSLRAYEPGAPTGATPKALASVEGLAQIRDQALEDAALIADQHWPESGHVACPEAVSCPMSISILIRRLKSTYASTPPPTEPR